MCTSRLSRVEGQASTQPRLRDPPCPSSVLCRGSPCQQQKLISTKSNKQGPSPRSWTLSWKQEAHWEPDQCDQHRRCIQQQHSSCWLLHAQGWLCPGLVTGVCPLFSGLSDQDRHWCAENRVGAKAAPLLWRHGPRKKVQQQNPRASSAPSAARELQSRRKAKSLRSRHH